MSSFGKGRDVHCFTWTIQHQFSSADLGIQGALEGGFTFTVYNCIVRMGFLPWEIRVAFLGESQLRQSRVAQPTVHAGCCSVSIVHRTLTWTTGSLTCAQMLMHAIAHGGVQTHVRESALRVDCGRKIPCRTGESNPRQRRDGPMLYPLSYIPILRVSLT